jgi:hypothetical protein
MIATNTGAYVAGLNGGRILQLTPGNQTRTIAGPNFSTLTAATSHALWATTKHRKLLRIALTY